MFERKSERSRPSPRAWWPHGLWGWQNGTCTFLIGPGAAAVPKKSEGNIENVLGEVACENHPGTVGCCQHRNAYRAKEKRYSNHQPHFYEGEPSAAPEGQGNIFPIDRHGEGCGCEHETHHDLHRCNDSRIVKRTHQLSLQPSRFDQPHGRSRKAAQPSLPVPIWTFNHQTLLASKFNSVLFYQSGNSVLGRIPD